MAYRIFVRFSAEVLAVAGAAFLCQDAVRADSIWSRRERCDSYLFEDNIARQVGDQVTILVQESTSIGENDQRALNKTSSFAHAFSFKGDSAAGKTVSRSGSADLSLTGSANRTLAGQANFTSGRTFTDAMTVTIIDRLPNGNLVVEGFRTRTLAGESRVLRMTGIIRPVDILNGNTVLSQFVSNFSVSYVGKGPETQFTRYGFFGQAMNIIWPF